MPQSMHKRFQLHVQNIHTHTHTPTHTHTHTHTPLAEVSAEAQTCMLICCAAEVGQRSIDQNVPHGEKSRSKPGTGMHCMVKSASLSNSTMGESPCLMAKLCPNQGRPSNGRRHNKVGLLPKPCRCGRLDPLTAAWPCRAPPIQSDSTTRAQCKIYNYASRLQQHDLGLCKGVLWLWGTNIS